MNDSTEHRQPRRDPVWVLYAGIIAMFAVTAGLILTSSPR